MADNVEKLVMLIEAQNKDVLRKLDQIEKKSRKTFGGASRNAAKFNREMAALSRSFLTGVFAGFTAAGGISRLTSAMSDAIPAASKLAKTADKVGVSIEDLQRLRFGFGLAGVDEGQSDTALQRFSRRIAQAAAGTGELYQIVKQNRVALREQDGSMRSNVDILRDYAELIKNAGSEQDRLLLAFKAFDTEGAGLVNALKGGSDGLDQLMGKINDAGGTLDSALAREAERIEDEFTTMWQSFETSAKWATINAASYVGDVARAISSANRSFDQWLMSVLPEDLSRNLATANLRNDLAGPFGTRDVNRGMFYRDDIGLPVISPTELTVRRRPTIIPQGGSKGGKSEYDREREKVEAVIEALKLEQMQIGMTADQKRVMNELRAAGSAATETERQFIEQTVLSNERATRQMEQLTEATEFFHDEAMSAFSSVIGEIETGNATLNRFVRSLAEASIQAAVLGKGPLAGLFGGGGGGGSGGLSGIARLFGGFFADGGNLGAGKWGIAGESGPEIIRGPATVVPMRANANGGGVVVSINMDARGADPAGLARLEARFSEFSRTLPQRIVAVTGQKQSRGTY